MEVFSSQKPCLVAQVAVKASGNCSLKNTQGKACCFGSQAVRRLRVRRPAGWIRAGPGGFEAGSRTHLALVLPGWPLASFLSLAYLAGLWEDQVRAVPATYLGPIEGTAGYKYISIGKLRDASGSQTPWGKPRRLLVKGPVAPGPTSKSWWPQLSCWSVCSLGLTRRYATVQVCTHLCDRVVPVA